LVQRRPSQNLVAFRPRKVTFQNQDWVNAYLSFVLGIDRVKVRREMIA
jgi:hypothetical protein